MTVLSLAGHKVYYRFQKLFCATIFESNICQPTKTHFIIKHCLQNMFSFLKKKIAGFEILAENLIFRNHSHCYYNPTWIKRSTLFSMREKTTNGEKRKYLRI